MFFSSQNDVVKNAFFKRDKIQKTPTKLLKKLFKGYVILIVINFFFILIKILNNVLLFDIEVTVSNICFHAI